MKELFNNLTQRNWHVTAPLYAGLMLSLAGIWAPPSWEPKMRKSYEVLVLYGMAAAAKSGPNGKDNAT